MSNSAEKLIRVELHCHSRYSKDSVQSLDAIIRACKRKGIDVLALTDHNEIAGAVKMKAAAPDWLTVIVGEEVATADGDIVALFLKERIPARLPIGDTIDRVHAQGGLVIAPHPFDRLRHEAIGGDVMAQVAARVDFIEVFNARNVFDADNQMAAAFVKRYKLRGVCSSDAHWPSEVGNATCLIMPFDGSTKDFADKLSQARLDYRRANMLVHVGTAAVKRLKKLPSGGHNA